MQILNLNENTIKISLTAHEITALFGSYEKIDYQSKNTKQVFKNLLIESKHLPKKDENLYIEVIPDTLGGCSIYFTKLKATSMSAKKLRAKKKQNYGTVYIINNSDQVICLSKNLNSIETEKQIMIYKSENGYILLTNENNNSAIHSQICEHADNYLRITKPAYSALKEHLKPIWHNQVT